MPLDSRVGLSVIGAIGGLAPSAAETGVLEDQAVGGAGDREADRLDDVAGREPRRLDGANLERPGAVADVDAPAADQRDAALDAHAPAGQLR